MLQSGRKRGIFRFFRHTACVQRSYSAYTKKEVDYVFDLDEHTYTGLMGYARKVAKAMEQALKPVRIAMTVEGLEVPHAHVHLIPIYAEGGPFRLGRSIELNKEEMRTISEQIAKHLD